MGRMTLAALLVLLGCGQEEPEPADVESFTKNMFPNSTLFLSVDPGQEVWLQVGPRRETSNDACIIDVEVWPSRWVPDTLTMMADEDCTFGQVIVREGEGN